METITRFKWTIFFVATLVLFIVFSHSLVVLNSIDFLKNLGYVGAVIAGFFFASVFTVVPATIVLFKLSLVLDPFFVVLWSTVGEVFSDYLILRFFRNGVFEELKPFFVGVGKKLRFTKEHSRLHFLAPVFGAIIIFSPFPDEVGIALMGLSKLKTWQFVILSFVLNAIGMFFVLKFAFVIS